MKLITEYNSSDVNFLTESVDKSGEKSYIIDGIFMQAEIQNRNGRIYEKRILEKAVADYVKEWVVPGRAVGELEHPDSPVVDFKNASHRITELRFEGNNVMGKAIILNTPMGNTVKGLMEGGVKLGVSSRGMGSIEEKNGKRFVSDDFVLRTVDIVSDPSAHDAFVNGIMEGVDWVWDNGIIKPEQIKKYETEVKKSTRADRAKIQEACFVDFLSKL